ncbi:membrane protein [Planomonospora venezuelensis]|nr:membrane protein [Planomonospora venezuelensis]
MAESQPRPGPGAAHPETDRPLPEHVTTPLLTLITARSMDEDYAHVAQKRAADGDVRPQVARPHWSSLLAVAALGLMAAVVAVQTDREAPANELSRTALVEQIDSRSEEVRGLQGDVAELNRSNAALASSSTRNQAKLDDIETRLRRAELVSGFSAVHGPGVRITVDNRPGGDVDGEVLDEDRATLVDGLFAAGAEAVAINDQRINALGGIRNTNRAVHVNGRPVNAPYEVSAIGDPQTLQARLIESSQGQQWFARVYNYGFVYDAQNVDDIRLPAAPERVLRDVIELDADPNNGPEREGSSP